VLDEFNCLPRDEDVTVVSALDSESVQTMAVGGDSDVLAELEEDGVHGLSALVDGCGHEHGLEGLEQRLSARSGGREET
jgi:hypothetical protein